MSEKIKILKIYDDTDTKKSGNHILRQILSKDIRRVSLLKLLQAAFKESTHEYSPLLVKMNLNRIRRLENNTKGGDKVFSDFNRHLDVHYSILNNSSIWIRLVDVNSSDNDTIEEIRWLNELGLYELRPAKEYIEYQTRAIRDNYLEEIPGEDSSGHGLHITPTIFGNEVEFRDFFLKNDNNRFKFLPKIEDNTNDNDDFKTDDISIRILLVDDKICGLPTKGQFVSSFQCGDCNVCNSDKKYCKLSILRQLLSGSFILNNKKDIFHKKTYWAENVESIVIDSINISRVWYKDKTNHLKNNENIVKELDSRLLNNANKKIVQIVGVRDIETALALMSCCKFDIILLDYLLDKRSNDDPERTYSTELFEFLSYDFKNKTVPSVISMLKESSSFDNNLLKEFQDNVKLNRGPLDKYWIVPMTSYNSSFISDLQRKHVRLIDHRWNISQGADPINTPWRFLYKLNEFVDLQLRLCVFWKKQLLTFIQFTCEDFEGKIKRRSEGTCLDEFQQFMGAEYANFMKRYGARKLIERDAATNNDNGNKSVFATYISENFYNNTDFIIETELNRLMRDFYYQAATMFDDRYGHKRLRETFERLRIFIAYNKLEKSVLEKDRDALLRGLRFLRVVIDSEFNCDVINKWARIN